MLKSLKTKIAITLLILLIISMLLVNLVVLFFWQRSLVQAEIDHVEAVVAHWHKRNNGRPIKQISSPTSLMEVCQTVGVSCKDIVFFDGQKEYAITKENRPAVSALLREGYSKNEQIKVTAGLTWKIFTFGGKYLYYVLPLKNTNGDRYSIGLVLDLDSIYENIAEQQAVIFFYIVVNAIVLGTIGFFRLVKYLLRPIDKLIDLSEIYTNSNDIIFSSSTGDNEFGRLSFALNSMLGRINADKHKLEENIQSLERANKQLIESQKKMVRVEKMAAVGRLSAGLAHEIGNPVGVVQGYLELLENDDLTPKERLEFSGRAVKELERVNKMVRQLLNFSRKSVGDNAFVSAGQVCKDTVGVLKLQKYPCVVDFKIELYDGEDVIGLSYDDLYQVLINCSFNAMDAIQDQGNGFSGKLFISSSLVTSPLNQPCLEIQLKDNGIGIPEEELTSVFDPFFTTKDIGKGTGLGLSISYGIIEAAGGIMEIDSVYGKGTKVMICLPLITLSKDLDIAQQQIANG